MIPRHHISGRLYVGQQIGSLHDEVVQSKAALDSGVGGVVVARESFLHDQPGNLAPRLLLDELEAAHQTAAKQTEETPGGGHARSSAGDPRGGDTVTDTMWIEDSASEVRGA